MLQGLDASNHQGVIDWQAVAASGRAFAFVKASEGKAFTDAYLAQNWADMRTYGLIRGAYHFARPSRNEPEAEAADFLAVIKSVGDVQPGDIVVLDMEDQDVAGGVDLLDWTLRWLLAVEQALGFLPMTYSGWWYLGPHGIYSRPEIVRYPLWLANWQETWPETTPGGWPRITIWQYSDQETIPGVAGPCDGDRFDGTAEELRALGKPFAEGVPSVPAEKTVADHLNRLWHVAGLLDGISAHDTAGVVREAVAAVKNEYHIP